MANGNAERTRVEWLETLENDRRDPDTPGSDATCPPSLDCASRGELRAIQDAKHAAPTPFLCEKSGFYLRRVGRLGLAPYLPAADST